ncbi:hypothetical protein [Chromobacterium sp.]|uniref:hypothetical protein n=1 Tax=Chromobacterium sp. TaxID=306190 RepID=UPI0035B3FEF3
MDTRPACSPHLSKLETTDALANGLDALNLLRPLLLSMRQQLANPQPNLGQLDGLCQAASWIADEYHNYLEALRQDEARRTNN